VEGQVPAAILALQEGALGAFMRGSSFAYPLAEILHILGFVVLVGGMAVVDLRILGLTRGVEIGPLHRQVRPWAIGAFILTLAMGVLLFAADAAHVFGNPAFRIKVILIVLAGLNAFVFHAAPERLHRTGAALSLLFWFGAIIAGRLIAYF